MAITAINPKKFLGANNPFTPMGPATEDSAIAPDFGAVPSSSGTFSSAISSPAIQPSLRGTKEFQEYSDVADKLREALNPHPVSTPRALLGALISRRNPMLGSVITGDYQRQRAIQPLMQQEQLLGNQLNMGREMENQRISNQEKQAQTGYFNAHAEQLLNPPLKPKEEDWSVAPGVLGPNGEPIQIEKNSGQSRILPLPGASVKDSTKPEAPHTVNVGQKVMQWNPKTQKYDIELGPTPKSESPEGSWTLQEDNQGKPVLFNSKTGQSKPAPAGVFPKGSHKPTVAEQNRSDLADNLNENLDKLEDIVNRRPELFGMVGGRTTQVRNFLGSNDKDIGALDTIEHQLGMVQQSTHGMRSAFGVQSAAKSVLNDFKNGPEALKGSIKAARDSAATFKKNVADKEGQSPTGGTYKRPSANVVVEQ